MSARTSLWRFPACALIAARALNDTIATLTNISPDPILAPLELHIVSIDPPTVTLANPSGTAAAGHPYVAAPLPTGELAPGATVTNVVLRFSNPTNARFTFTHQVFGTVAATNAPPIADAGPDQSAPVNATVTLDGSGSTDADGDDLTYDWTLVTAPAASTATLVDSTMVNPRLTLDQAGDYTARLVVNDGQVDSAPDTVTLSTQNTPPVADAGPDQSARVQTTVTLDGSGSSDVDGDALTFAWALVTQPAGSLAALINPATVTPRLTLDRAGTYTAQLLVNDGQADSAPDSVTLTTENSPPVAHAGLAQSVPLGATVQLSGVGSRDADGDALTYQWTLTSVPMGSAATLTNPTAVNPTFSADQPGAYVAQLMVNDGTVNSVPDTVTISTENSKPVADAGPDQSAEIGQTVILDGRGSRDADGDVLIYLWALTTRPAGSLATLQDVVQEQAQLTPDVAGVYIAQLIVNDGQLASDPDTMTVTVTDPTPANRDPQITSSPVTTATVNQPYIYDVNATDPDAGDVLTYALTVQPAGMTIDPISGVMTWTPSQAGGANVTVQVTDLGGLFDTQDFVITVTDAPPTNQAPQVNAGADQTITLPASANLSGTVTDDGLPNPPGVVTVTWSQVSGPADVFFADSAAANTVALFPIEGTYVLRLTADDGALSKTDDVAITVNLFGGGSGGGGDLPPDPVTVAPPVDSTVATTIYAATEFLYTGAHPIQTGVAPGTIEAKRAAVLRGKVLDKNNAPLSGVTVAILNHPEFGQTLSRADGMFDLAANGGGLLTVTYQKTGYLPVQRQANVPWQDFVVLDDVVMIALDPQATPIDLSAATPIQVARGSAVTDSDGTRQATLLFPQGTTATVNGVPLTTLTIRATEYTVGENGPATMPGPLPPSSGYTYAVELSADEAPNQEVRFSQPVITYVENFLDFPVGGEVPVGYYDRAKAAWIPSENGRIIKILSITGGLADLDTNGDSAADDAATLTALGVTDAERQQLATLYNAGQSLWRVPITHFTPWDCNWPFGPPEDAEGSDADEPESDKKPDDECIASGSLIGCESQTLGENLPLVGTGLSLHYRSDRVPGRLGANTVRIPLSGATVPASLKRIEAQVHVAGRSFNLGTFPTQSNQATTFTWDGLDAYSRRLEGSHPATVTIGFVYDGVYQQPGSGNSFGASSGIAMTGNRTRQEITLPRTTTVDVSTVDFRMVGLGGWTFDAQHWYNPTGRTLYLGDGARRGKAIGVSNVLNTVAGSSILGADYGDGGPATQASLATPQSVTVTADGSIL